MIPHPSSAILSPRSWALALVILCMPLLGAADAVAEKAATYKAAAEQVIAMCVSGKVDLPLARTRLGELGQLADWYADRFTVAYPASAKVMAYMKAQRDRLPTLTLEQIDAQYEEAALAKAHGAEFGVDLMAEDNEYIHNPIDLFVHPATALICLREWEKDHNAERLKRATSELQEVIEHNAHASQTLSNKKP